jgi:antitoxin component YwqK of YwqJK toxin-antitoxin module
MKIFITIVALATTTTALAQQHIITYYDAFKKYKKEVYDIDSKGEKNGKYVSYFENGKIRMEQTFLHGKLNGKETAYYDDGYRYRLAHVYSYKNDKQDGLQQDYAITESSAMNNIGIYKYPVKEEFYGKTDTESWKKEYNDVNGKKYMSKLTKDGVEKGYRSDGHQWYQKTDNGHCVLMLARKTINLFSSCLAYLLEIS